jgi:integrase
MQNYVSIIIDKRWSPWLSSPAFQRTASGRHRFSGFFLTFQKGFWSGGMTGTKAPLKILLTNRTRPAPARTVNPLSAVIPEHPKRATCHTFRHSSATHLLEGGYDIKMIQEIFRHGDVKTTMIYTHVLNRGPAGVRSPMDRL